MLCFGQSAFFRFNHPEEALYMKSLLPTGLSVPRTQPDGKRTIFFCFSSKRTCVIVRFLHQKYCFIPIGRTGILTEMLSINLGLMQK